MKRFKKLITGILITAMAVSLIGCGSSAGNTDGNASGGANSGSGSGDVANSGDEGEKVLRVGVLSVDDQPFDPSQASLTVIDQISPVFDSLIEMDGNGEYAPGLATDWTLSEDKLSFTLTIREGVKFQDGSDLTSEDVKFSLDLYGSDASNAADKNLMVKYVESVEAPDDYTVVLNFKSPCAEFEYLLSSNATGLGMVLPKDYYEEVGPEVFGQQPIGAGPFKVESFSPGNEVVFSAFQDYWQGPAKIDQLIFKQYSEESTRIAELQTGSLDFAPINDASVAILEGSDVITIETVDYTSTLGLFISGAYDNTGAATQDARVREALSLAINREEIVDAIFEGNAIVSDVWGLFPFTYGYDGSYPSKTEYNPEKAQELLEEAGYPNNFSQPVVKFYLPSGYTYYEDVAQAIVAYWQVVGIQAEIIPIDKNELTTLYRARPLSEDFSGAVYYFNPPKKYSAYDAFQPFYPSTSSIGLIQGNAEFDQKIADIATMAGAEREALVNSALEDVEEAAVSIPLVYPGQRYAVSTRVATWDSSSSGHSGRWYYTFELQ